MQTWSRRLTTDAEVERKLDVGSSYLLTKLNEEPATSLDLAAATRKLALTFQELAIDYLAEVGDSELDPLLRDADEATLTMQSRCK